MIQLRRWRKAIADMTPFLARETKCEMSSMLTVNKDAICANDLPSAEVHNYVRVHPGLFQHLPEKGLGRPTILTLFRGYSSKILLTGCIICRSKTTM